MATRRIDILDGWRALSILLVLAGHLFPMGPKSWAMNGPVATTGMALFFTLSGFLIVRFLLDRPDVPEFLRRRLFRIVPLAWVAMIVLAVANRAGLGTLAANLLFVANLPPQRLMEGGVPLWSLCVEMQFYGMAALLVAVGGRRGLYALPVLCLAVTGLRVQAGAYNHNVTWLRADEILAGATLALLVHARAHPRRGGSARPTRLLSILPVLLVMLVVASAHPATGWLNYVRPYIAAAAVGTSLYAAPEAMKRLFASRPAVYVAQISYALYVLHGMLAATWLGSGDTTARYLKRPLLLLATFALAHVSTFRFERPLIDLGKRIGRGAALPSGRGTT